MTACSLALVKVFQLTFLQGAEQRSLRPGIRTVSPVETDMHLAERIYRRTDAGRQASVNQSADVPVEYRRVLQLVGTGTPTAVIRACLRSHPYEHILQWLAKLEEVGLLESIPQAGADDLDLSGNFKRAALAAAHNARV